MYGKNYVIKSLELHLFFGRIMKEHSLFLRAGFTPADAVFSRKAEFFMKEFEKLLSQAVALGNGIVSNDVLCSGEVVTDFTAMAEKQTEQFTGIPINKNITSVELRMNSGCGCNISQHKIARVRRLNRTALNLLNGLIFFKENILRRVISCKMFTANYPLLIDHIIREAKLYREYVECLEKCGDLSEKSMKEVESFWNRIMMEHALFIRGLLDPCETELFDTADDFAQKYASLLDTCRNAHNRMLTADALEETEKFRDFKKAGTKGIEECKIRSIILPLLADHVLREANHYIRLLSLGR